MASERVERVERVEPLARHGLPPFKARTKLENSSPRLVQHLFFNGFLVFE